MRLPRTTAEPEMLVERDLIVPARDGVGLATDVYRPGTGLGRFRCCSNAPPTTNRRRAAPSAPPPWRAPRSRAEVAAYFVAARLRRRLSGLPRPLQIGRPLHKISERGRGRLRHARLAPAPALVQRPHRHLRAVLCGAHAGGARLPRSAGTGGAVPRLRRLLQRLSQRHPPWRRLRSEAGDLGLSTTRSPTPGPGGQGGLAGRRTSGAWFARMPWRKGDSPLSAAPEYEDYLFEQWSHGVFDDFWKQPGIYAEGYYDRYADVPIVHLSGWYDPYARTAVENYRRPVARASAAGCG